MLLTMLWLLPALGVAGALLAALLHAQWRGEIAAFEAADRAQPPAPGAVLFIGSSSMRLWTTLAGDFPERHTINRGFGGSEIDDATHFADRIVAPYRPSAIVMYAGDNDIAAGRAPQDVAADLRAFVVRVRRELPGVPVVYVSIKPSVARWSLWPAMREANGLIRDWAAAQRDVRFVDIAPAMLDARGKPRAELFRDDGLHMNAAGYAIWIAAPKPVLAGYGFRTAQAASATPAASASK
jgi:lysophospholipase L1-like esterase